MFELNTSDLINLRKFYRKAPRLFQRATASMLNSMAFGTRNEALRIILSRMTNRDERFVKGSLQVQKTSGSRSIDRQVSIAGSVTRPRFTGWAEQQLGTPTARTRVANIEGRGGSFDRKVIGRARLKPNQKFRDMDEVGINVGNDAQRIIAFLNIMKRENSKQSFLIPRKVGKWKKGLYKFKGQRVVRLQNLEPSNLQPKKFKWMTFARSRFLAQMDFRQEWGDAVRFVMRSVRV